MYFSQTISKGSAEFARPGHTLAVGAVKGQSARIIRTVAARIANVWKQRKIHIKQLNHVHCSPIG